MKKLIIILTLITLTSCGLTNQEISEEINTCRSKGLWTREVTNMLWDTTKIICTNEK